MLKNIINNLRFLLRDNSTDTCPEEVKEEAGAIKFTLLKDGNVKIFMYWDEHFAELPKMYAQMLHHINIGSYQESIVDIIGSISDEEPTPEQQKFIQEILQLWGYLNAEHLAITAIQQEQQQNKPIIPPSRVFGGPQG
jgi:hypothetical protein